MLEPSKYKSTPLAFQYLPFAFILVLGGRALLKGGNPTCTWAVQGQLAYAHEQKTICSSAYATVPNTTRVHPQEHGKIESTRVNSHLNLSFDRMYVN